jgi:hypothetical protein
MGTAGRGQFFKEKFGKSENCDILRNESKINYKAKVQK